MTEEATVERAETMQEDEPEEEDENEVEDESYGDAPEDENFDSRGEIAAGDFGGEGAERRYR